MSARDAWYSLRDQASNTSTVGNLLGNQNLKEWGHQQETEIATANRMCDEALHSNLPGDALESMVSDMAAYFSEELPKQPEVQASSKQLVLAFSPVDSKTDNPQTLSVMRDLRVRLFQNEAISSNFVFVESSEADANALKNKIAGGDLSAFRDPLQKTADKTKAVTYNPESVFLIKGNLASSPDKPNHQVEITMTFDIVPMLARTTQLSKSFSRTYMWHPTKNKWELQA